jgi:cyclopropane-fatty-acyl-phospholipid synthase
MTFSRLETLNTGAASATAPLLQWPSLSSGNLPRAARLVLHMLKGIESGCMHVILPQGECIHFGNPDEGLPAVLAIRDIAVFRRVLQDGDIGFAEAYLDSQWTTPDLPSLLTLLARNRAGLHDAVYGNWWGRLVHRVRHWRNRNSRSGSRRNIHAHYDIGNAFYRLWLDQSMTYSSALFDAEIPISIEAAQERKYLRLLGEVVGTVINSGRAAHILEVGCGWGGFAEIAVKAGHRITGITLSDEQLAYARERLTHSGRAKFELTDYRDVRGQFDAIVSIEMFEAVGEQWWPSYFSMIKDRLAPGGRAAVQTITIDESLFETYRHSSDFIQQYIFPGGMLPSSTRFEADANRAGLKVVNRMAFGADYARTLATWRSNFHAQLNEVHALGFDERFIRVWDFYLAYCEAGFMAGSTNVMHFTLEHA